MFEEAAEGIPLTERPAEDRSPRISWYPCWSVHWVYWNCALSAFFWAQVHLVVLSLRVEEAAEEVLPAAIPSEDRIFSNVTIQCVLIKSQALPWIVMLASLQCETLLLSDTSWGNCRKHVAEWHAFRGRTSLSCMLATWIKWNNNFNVLWCLCTWMHVEILAEENTADASEDWVLLILPSP